MSTNSAPKNQNSGWSWGGFMFSPVVIFASRRYWWILFYLLALIPIVGWLIPMLILGLKGRSLVMGNNAFSPEEARGFMKGVDHAGKIAFWILIVVLVVGVIFGLATGAGILSMLGAFSGDLSPIAN